MDEVVTNPLRIRTNDGTTTSNAIIDGAGENEVEGGQNAGQDTAAWAQDIFQLKGSGGSKEAEKKKLALDRITILLLFVLGVSAGLVNGVILMANAALCKLQVGLFFQCVGCYFVFVYYRLLVECSVLIC